MAVPIMTLLHEWNLEIQSVRPQITTLFSSSVTRYVKSEFIFRTD